MVPRSLLSFRLQAAPCRGLSSQKVQCDVPQDREVLGSVPLPDAAVILAEGNVQYPMQLVLDSPMAARRVRSNLASLSRLEMRYRRVRLLCLPCSRSAWTASSPVSARQLFRVS